MSTAGTLQVSGERTSGASIRSQNGERSLLGVLYAKILNILVLYCEPRSHTHVRKPAVWVSSVKQ